MKLVEILFTIWNLTHAAGLPPLHDDTMLSIILFSTLAPSTN